MSTKLLINPEAIKYKKFSSEIIKLSKDLDINDYESKIMKKLGQNSFSNVTAYDLSSCVYFNYNKQKLLLELNSLLPEYEAFIKIKSCMYIKDETNKFNTVKFSMDKDENSNRLWITVIVEFDEEHSLDLKKEKEEELE